MFYLGNDGEGAEGYYLADYLGKRLVSKERDKHFLLLVNIQNKAQKLPSDEVSYKKTVAVTDCYPLINMVEWFFIKDMKSLMYKDEKMVQFMRQIA